jgi:hypothetical protein
MSLHNKNKVPIVTSHVEQVDPAFNSNDKSTSYLQ